MITGRAEIGWIPEDINPDGFKTIPELLDHCVKNFGNKPAFTSLGKTITYNELAELSTAFAHFLQTETNLKPGDRIAIQLPNLIQYPIVLFGSILAGMIAVNTNPLYTAREMEYQFKDSGAKALIIYQCMAPNAEKILANTNIETVVLVQAADLHGSLKRTLIHAVIKYVKKMQPDFNLPQALSIREILNKHKGKKHAPVEATSATTAVLQYTGGTTGYSKGAELTHANILSNILQALPRIRTSREDWAETAISPPTSLPHICIYPGANSYVIWRARRIDSQPKGYTWIRQRAKELETYRLPWPKHPVCGALSQSRICLY